MPLKQILEMTEPYTVICFTYNTMREEWYLNKRVIPENILQTPSIVSGIGAIHPESNEFPVNEPAIRLYVEEI